MKFGERIRGAPDARRASLDVPIPLGPFFSLSGGTYRVSAEYSDANLKVSGEGTLALRD